MRKYGSDNKENMRHVNLLQLLVTSKFHCVIFSRKTSCLAVTKALRIPVILDSFLFGHNRTELLWMMNGKRIKLYLIPIWQRKSILLPRLIENVYWNGKKLITYLLIYNRYRLHEK